MATTTLRPGSAASRFPSGEINGERILHEAHIAEQWEEYHFWSGVWGGVFMILMYGAGLIFLPIWFATGRKVGKVIHDSISVVLTEETLYYYVEYYSCCCCCLAITEKNIPLSKIQDLQVTQGWYERRFNLSTIQVQTAGTGTAGTAEASLNQIANPREFRDAVMRQVKIERQGLRGGRAADPNGTSPSASGEKLDIITEAPRRTNAAAPAGTANEEALLGSILNELRDINRDVSSIKNVAEKHR